MTALFADVVGSTALGETLPLDEVKALIGECLDRMASAIESFGGEVTAFMGDGIAAFFGLAGAREDDHQRAAMAAIEIRRLISEYAKEVEAAWGVQQLNVRIGLNSGRVAVGRLNAKAPQLHALGDAVNIAARLQGLASPGSILIGGVVADTLVDRFDVVALGLKHVKGRKEPVEAFELKDELPTVQRLPLRPMMGRETELSRLAIAVSEVGAGRGQMMFILGEPGVGKTRLLQEARSVAGPGVLWMEGRCDPSSRRLPYAPFTRVLQAWLGIDTATPDVAVRIRLKAKLRDLMGESDSHIAPQLAGLLGVDLEPKQKRRLEGLPVEALTKGLHVAYGRWVEALAKSMPVVIAVDNFAQADDATAQLTEALLSVTERVPLLLLLTMRTDTRAPGWRLRAQGFTEFAHRTAELTIQPLSRPDSERLLGALDAEQVLSERVKAAIVSRAEGNPLYLEELFHAVAEQHSPVTRDTNLGGVPPGLEKLLLSRVDGLSVEARRLMQAAAVLGRSFQKSVLEKMRVVSDSDAVLREVLRADLIREYRLDPIEFHFKHGLVRDAVLSTMTRGAAKDLHRRAARAIEACFAPHLENHVEALAEHYESAGDHGNAVEFIEGVAERLASVYKYHEAIHALDICRRYVEDDKTGPTFARVTKRSAELKGLVGRGIEASLLIDELMEVERNGEQQGLLAAKAQILTECGALEEADAALDKCRSAGSSVSGPLVTCLTAQIQLRRDQLVSARESLEALGDLTDLSDELAFAACTTWAGYNAAIGSFSEGRAWAERSLGIARRAGSIALELRAERYLAVVQLLDGDLTSAFTLLRGVWVSYHELGATIGEVETAINLVHVAELSGLLRRGWDIGRSSLDVAEAPLLRAALCANLATTAFELGDSNSAEDLAMSALSVGEDAPPFARFVALTALAEVHGAKGDLDKAEEYLHLAQREAERSPGRRGQRVSVHVAISNAALKRGQVEMAKREAEKAISYIASSEKPLHASAFRTLGAAVGATDPEAGLGHLQRALRLSRDLEMKLEEARILAAMGRLEKERAPSYFDRAHQLFLDCGSQRGVAELAEARASH